MGDTADQYEAEAIDSMDEKDERDLLVDGDERDTDTIEKQANAELKTIEATHAGVRAGLSPDRIHEIVDEALDDVGDVV